MLSDYWAELRLRTMGCAGHLIVGDAPAGLLEWAAAELERLEQCWSRFRPDSELSLLNDAPEEVLGLSAPMAEVLVRAVEGWRATDGLFDPTILEALEHAGYRRPLGDPRPDEPRADEPRADDPADGRPAPAPGFGTFEVDGPRRSLRRPPGVRIDLGGIGKGLAADLVAEGLVDRGARHACVGLGGDIRVAGLPPDGGWAIPVEDPRLPERPWFTHRLTEGAIVTSTTLLRRWRTPSGAERHHLVDPRTGRCAEAGLVAAVVAGPTAWWSEVLAKAAVIAGPIRGRDLLDAHRVEAWLVDHDAAPTPPAPTPGELVAP